jgi:RNA polymerase sigma-70 factor (ECF subfamily)
VEDIVQSVFATFFRRVGQGFYDSSNLDAVWKVLLVITMNRIRSMATYYYAAKRDAHRTVSGASARLNVEMKSNTSTFVPAHAELILKDILERLPTRSRMVLRLRVDGFSVGEVARITGLSSRTVERIISHARLTLSELLRTEQ